MDETRTRAYQGALARQRQGQGDLPTRSGSLWQALTRTGPTANQTLQAAQQRQAVFDEQTRQPGRPSVTEERMLLDMNQTNPRAYRR
jgi:hypothetical protein